MFGVQIFIKLYCLFLGVIIEFLAYFSNVVLYFVFLTMWLDWLKRSFKNNNGSVQVFKKFMLCHSFCTKDVDVAGLHRGNPSPGEGDNNVRQSITRQGVRW